MYGIQTKLLGHMMQEVLSKEDTLEAAGRAAGGVRG